MIDRGGAVVLTKTELIAAFQNEARLLNHLIAKIDYGKLDYRPSKKQRSTGDLVKYLSMMGPSLVQVALTGSFDRSGWSAAEQKAAAGTVDQAVAVIAAHPVTYTSLLGDVPEARFHDQIEILGRESSRAFVLVSLALAHCAAYRTQLFLYLKATGHDELTSSNLWMGADPTPST